MKTGENISIKESSKSSFFKTVLDDKRSMREHVRKFGTLKGFKSKNFEFTKPI
jgi:hypothetical protein